MVDIDIRTEIGPLRDVVVHRPGPEIGRMTQHDLERLLFDDILSPSETAAEHDVLTGVLRRAGVVVHEFLELLREALSRATAAAREVLLERVCALAGATHMAEELQSWSPEALARGLVQGIHWHELEGAVGLARIRARLFDPTDMALRPVPNLMFMRDPAIAVHSQMVVSRMRQSARAREALLAGFALRWGLPGGYGPILTPLVGDPHPGADVHHTLEGGDVLVLSDEVVMVGCSERTSAQGIERFANELLFPNQPSVQVVYAVMMPEQRSLMHLDTILTQVDERLFLGHRPLVAGDGGHHGTPVRVARVSRDQAPTLLGDASVLDVLREALGDETQLVSCGGDDPMTQEREQWTDGANAVCVAPGKIILYSRNRKTIEALARHGFGETRLSAVQDEEKRGQLVDEGLGRERNVFSFSGSELSRARGGGRCLTMPLRRDTPT